MKSIILSSSILLTNFFAQTAVAAPPSASVKMYTQPTGDLAIDESCDLFWQGDFAVKSRTGGFYGTIEAKLSGTSTCEIPAPQSKWELVFFSHPHQDDCGTYTANFGAVHFVDGKMERDLNGKPLVYQGRYEDNRTRTCENVVAALIVVSFEVSISAGEESHKLIFYSNP